MSNVAVEVRIVRILVTITAFVVFIDLFRFPHFHIASLTRVILAFSLTFAILSSISRVLGYRDTARIGPKMSSSGNTVGFWIQTIAIAVQAIAVTGALIFGFQELREARSAYQAATINDVSTRSAELQWRVLNDPELAPLLIGNATLTPELKRDLASGLIINHFAMIYDLRMLGGIPSETWEGFSSDIEFTMKTPAFSRRWSEVRTQHGERFRSYVDRITGWKEE